MWPNMHVPARDVNNALYQASVTVSVQYIASYYSSCELNTGSLTTKLELSLLLCKSICVTFHATYGTINVMWVVGRTI